MTGEDLDTLTLQYHQLWSCTKADDPACPLAFLIPYDNKWCCTAERQGGTQVLRSMIEHAFDDIWTIIEYP